MKTLKRRCFREKKTVPCSEEEALGSPKRNKTTEKPPVGSIPGIGGNIKGKRGINGASRRG